MFRWQPVTENILSWLSAPAEVLCTNALIGADPSLLIITQSTPAALALRKQAPKFLGSWIESPVLLLWGLKDRGYAH
jgi:hypothetical protein